MADVEIYLENVDEESILEWMSSIFEELVELERDEDLVVYSGKYKAFTIPINIQKNVEDKDLTGVWFNSKYSPWETDIDCAREAFEKFGQRVQCDPGSDYPLPNQFYEISSTGERVIEI